MNSRIYEDLTEKGKQEKSSTFVEEMMAAAKILP